MSTERLGAEPPSRMPAPLQSAGETKAHRSTVKSIFQRRKPSDWKTLSVVVTTSLILHAIILGACAFIILKNPQLIEEIFTTITDPKADGDPIVEQSLFQPDELQTITPDQPAIQEMTSSRDSAGQGSIEFDVSDAIPQFHADPNSVVGLPDLTIADETAGRMTAASKRAMLTKFGGNSASEAAVASGMKWLLNHQMPNGSWTFAHSKHVDCKGQCSQDGTFASCPTGATAMALLAFLGGGHTHQAGDHQPHVKKAVDFLLKSGKQTSTGIDFRGKVTANEGMYVQGLCAIALCECAAMTKGDHRITKAAEGAIEFIVKAQNSNDGGWRYQPNEAGDLSVSGWQVMALKSGYHAKLKFPTRTFSQTFKNVEKFLLLTQSDGGAHYNYTPVPANSTSNTIPPNPTMTAVGLLCRMYLGWDHKNKKLAEGIEFLDKIKPQPNNMYFNYYATQVMHHWGGEEWNRWNQIMRDQLIKTQHPLKDGHLAGSWDIADPHGGGGGRLYMTCLSVMTLEVYYRHLPIYSSDRIKVEF